MFELDAPELELVLLKARLGAENGLVMPRGVDVFELLTKRISSELINCCK